MQSILEHLVSGDFMPHGHCYLWLPEILWTNVASDAVIAAAYYSIPISLVAFVRKRKDVDFKAIPVLFSAFIFLCGTTHLFGIFTVWNGYYGVQGMIKAATAMVSIATAVIVWRMLPQALAIPSGRQLRERVDEATSELMEKNHQLKKANSEIEDFVSAASHDLKEPLRTVIAYSQLLETDADGNLNDNAKADLEHIMAGAKRMQALVGDLLDLSRISRAEIVVDRVDLNRVVDEVRNALKASIEASQARIEKGELPVVHGDAVLLRQVYSNLISNALKFARPETAPVITLTAEQARDGDWILGVADNGIGIEQEYRNLVFAPFKRLQGRDHSDGTGIGLAICQRAIERHQGHIWIEDHPGGGCHFRFTLDGASGGQDSNGQH